MLFFTFLLLGVALFVIVYLYSVHQLKQQNLNEEVFDPIEQKDGFMSKFLAKFTWSKKRDSELFDRGEGLAKNEPTLGGSESLEDATSTDETTMSIGGVVATVATAATNKPEFDKPKVNVRDDVNDLIKRKKPTDTGSFNAAESEFSEEPIKDISSSKESDELSNDFDAVPLDQLAQELESSHVVDKHLDQHNGEQITGVSDDSVFQRDLLLEKSHQALLKESLEEKEISQSEKIDSGFYQSPQASTSKDRNFKASANAIEIVAKISGHVATPRDDCLGLYRRYDYLFTRKLGVFGRNSLTHIWENMELADQSVEFDDIAVSLQLADKSGAMTRKESNTFSTLALEFADKLDKTLALSMDLDEAVEKGRMLDELARKYDAMVVCNIIPKRRKGFRSTDIQSCTRDLQMVQSKNGVFGRFDDVKGHASLRYSLAIASSDGKYIPVTGREPFQVEDIVVFLNVPLMKDPVEAFDLMIRDARKLAAWLDGKIVDKNERNMTARTLDKLSEQIVILEKEMALDGLVPGSALCKKLF